MKNLTISTLLFLSLIVNGCASLESISTSSIPKNRSQPVKAESSKFIVLGFNFDNNYASTIVTDLANQCPNGKVQGLLTKQESINYFLYLFWTSKITATGYCVSQSVASNSTKIRKPGSTEEEVTE